MVRKTPLRGARRQKPDGTPAHLVTHRYYRVLERHMSSAKEGMAGFVGAPLPPSVRLLTVQLDDMRDERTATDDGHSTLFFNRLH